VEKVPEELLEKELLNALVEVIASKESGHDISENINDQSWPKDIALVVSQGEGRSSTLELKFSKDSDKAELLNAITGSAELDRDGDRAYASAVGGRWKATSLQDPEFKFLVWLLRSVCLRPVY
jgi:hypothetical protein